MTPILNKPQGFFARLLFARHEAVNLRRLGGQPLARQARAELSSLAGKKFAQRLPVTASQGQAVARQNGVSSFLPVEAPSTSASQSAPRTPMERAESYLAREGQRLEESKYKFTPEQQARADKKNAAIDQKNAQIQEKLKEVEQKRAAIESDPKLSPKQKAEKLKKLDRERADLQKQIKPHVDLASTTRSVDQVMNDPNLSGKQKKKKIDALRKEMGLSKKEMHRMITDPLSKAYSASKKRVEAHGKAVTKALDEQIKSAEKLYGKKSPEVEALKSQRDGVKQVHSQTAKQLGSTAKALHKMYKPVSLLSKIGGALAKVGKVFSKIVDMVMPLIAMIPGVGQIAAAVWAGVKMVTAAIKGQWGNMLSSLASAIPAVGGAIGGAAAKVADVAAKAINYATKGINVVKNLKNGNIAGALAEGASMASGAGGGLGKAAKVLSEGAKVAGVAQQAARGDYLGALSQASGLLGDVGGGKAAKVLSEGVKIAGVAQQAARGNYLGALDQASGVLGDLGAGKASKVLSEGAKVANVAQQVAAGHYGAALNQASVFLPEEARSTIQRTARLANDGEDAFRHLKKGDLNGVSTALNHAAAEGPSALRPALNKVAEAATQAQAKADAFESQMKNALRNIG
jgi:hypothetical protein